MNYFSLYRRYRPESFDNVIGQQLIIKTLTNAIMENKINHAYLFSGQHGTGKTSTARILARAINCSKTVNGNPCLKCQCCLNFNNNSSDLVELDAASNNSVDQIRDLIDQAAYAPLNCRYKVYIIDEVHMLSISAFNAMLKILEEPPQYIVFILATTEPYKLPLTVISRCQHFVFDRVHDAHLHQHLVNIAKKENFVVDPYLVDKIVMLADGSVRDALSILDQLAIYSSNKKLDASILYKTHGLIEKEEILTFLQAILKKDTKELLDLYYQFKIKNINFVYFAYDLINLFGDLVSAVEVTLNNQTNNHQSQYFTEADLKPFLDNYNLNSLREICLQLSKKIQLFIYNTRGHNDATLLFKLLVFDFVEYSNLKMPVTAAISDDATLVKPDEFTNFKTASNVLDEPTDDKFVDNESSLDERKDFDFNESKPLGGFSNTILDNNIDDDSPSIDSFNNLAPSSKDEEKPVVETNSFSNNLPAKEDKLEADFFEADNTVSDNEDNFSNNDSKDDEVILFSENVTSNSTKQTSLLNLSENIVNVKSKSIELPDDDEVKAELDLTKVKAIKFDSLAIFTIFMEKNDAIKTLLEKKITALEDVYNFTDDESLIANALQLGIINQASAREVVMSFDDKCEDEYKTMLHYYKSDVFASFQEKFLNAVYNFYFVKFNDYQDLSIEYRKLQQVKKLPAPQPYKSFFNKTSNNNKKATMTSELIKIIKKG